MKEVEDYIYKFLQYTVEFHQYLKRVYKIEVYPSYNEAGSFFPRSGVFILNGQTFNYRYHGSGCTLIIDDIIIDYDLDILSENKVEISSWKFNRFIESYSKGTSTILIDDLDEIFINLTEKGVLLRKDPDFFVFTINESFF
jgi:hypothetical protein